jgi:Uma2 family endonuclease
MRRAIVSERQTRYGTRTRSRAARAPKRMTEEEFVEWYWKTDKTVRAEWVDGEVIMMSPDNVQHHDNEGLMYRVLSEYVGLKKLGRIFHSRIQIRLPVRPSRREPDIFFVASDRTRIIHETFIDGAPDFALEIVSLSSSERDFRIKFYEYAEAGVKEYWIVHLLNSDLSAYSLNAKGKYDSIAPKAGKVHSKVIPEFYWRKEWLHNAEQFLATDILKEMGAL